MTKQKQKSSKQQTRQSKPLLVGIVVIVIAVALGAIFGVIKVSYYNAVSDRANIVQVREMIRMSAEAVKKPAPVDYKTADVYFPEARLYLPSPGTNQALTYAYYPGLSEGEQDELSVSTNPVFGTTALYAANNVDELFESALPKLQACARGVKILRQKLPDTDEQNDLRHTVQLASGQTLYIYTEKACPELDETADLLKNIRDY